MHSFNIALIEAELKNYINLSLIKIFGVIIKENIRKPRNKLKNTKNN